MKSLITFLLTLFIFEAAHSATYYVATNGNNNYEGTKEKPLRTVAYAVSKMVAGDTTYVRGGTYNEGAIRFRRSGSFTKPIKLLNYPNEFPVINFNTKDYFYATGVKKFNRILIQHTEGINKPMGYITIMGLELKNGFDGIKFHSAHNLTIRKNWIHDNLNQGILGIGGYKISIDQNKISRNGDFIGCANGTNKTFCFHIHGIYAHGSYYTITNNLIYGNQGYGVQQNGTSSYDANSMAGKEFAGASNWLIANNTIAYQENRGAISLWGPLCHDTRIENNIFYENASKKASESNGISLYSPTPAKGIIIRNNLSYATGSGGTKFIDNGYNSYQEGVHYIQSGNIINTLSPKFVNAPATLLSAPNFALTSQSPAINRGLTNPLVKFDFLGVARPQGGAYDIGAYEYTGK